MKVEDVDQVTVGMTRSQVRYVLGTPMLADPFDPQRWDYIYTLQRGRDPNIDRAHFVVRFDGDKVSRDRKGDLPAGYTDPVARRKKLAAAAAGQLHRPPRHRPPNPSRPLRCPGRRQALSLSGAAPLRGALAAPLASQARGSCLSGR